LPNAPSESLVTTTVESSKVINLFTNFTHTITSKDGGIVHEIINAELNKLVLGCDIRADLPNSDDATFKPSGLDGHLSVAMADINVDALNLPVEVKTKLAEIDLELSEGRYFEDF